MIPTVAVQVAEPQHEQAPLMIEACTAALRRGRCELAVSDSATPPSAVAIVSWRGADRSEVVVEVGASEQAGARWLSQSVEFQPGDPSGERWRVVGITIATLVGDLEDAVANEVGNDDAATDALVTPAAEPPTRPDDANAVEQSEPVVVPRDSSATRTVQNSPIDAISLSAGGSLGLAAGSGASRFGFWVRGDWALAEPLFLTASGAYAARPRVEDVSPRWQSGSVGAGALRVVGPLGAQARVELLVERVAVSDSDTTTRSKVLVGARLGVVATWPTRGRVAIVGGGELTRHSRGVRVRRDGAEVVTFPPSTYTVLLGARASF